MISCPGRNFVIFLRHIVVITVSWFRVLVYSSLWYFSRSSQSELKVPRENIVVYCQTFRSGLVFNSPFLASMSFVHWWLQSLSTNFSAWSLRWVVPDIVFVDSVNDLAPCYQHWSLLPKSSFLLLVWSILLSACRFQYSSLTTWQIWMTSVNQEAYGSTVASDVNWLSSSTTLRWPSGFV